MFGYTALCPERSASLYLYRARNADEPHRQEAAVGLRLRLKKIANQSRAEMQRPPDLPEPLKRGAQKLSDAWLVKKSYTFITTGVTGG